MEPLTDKQIREKLLSRGASTLTDAELLSLLLVDSGGTLLPVDTAERLLRQWNGSLSAIAAENISAIRQRGAISIRSAATICAALELGRRMNIENASQAQSINCTQDAVRLLRPAMTNLQHEEFWAIYLTSTNRIIERRMISSGGVSSTVVDAKLIVKRAIELLATSIILVHNHPSGTAQPSQMDRVITDNTIAAARLFDISVLDHIIISREESFSFMQAGLM